MQAARQFVSSGWLTRQAHTLRCRVVAGVAQWQSSSLPSWPCGFDSHRPLQHHYMVSLGRGLTCSILILVGSAGRSVGDNGWEGRILSFTEENDAPFHTDRHYTQGASVSFLSRDEALPGWLASISDYLPAIGLHVEARKFGIAAGQEIYTPANLQTSAVISDDRPYAGWLFGSFTLQRRGPVSAA